MTQKSMFKTTTNSTALRANLKEMLDLVKEPGDRLQLLQREQPIRVLITQQEFLDLFTKAQAYENLGPENSKRSERVDASDANRDKSKKLAHQRFRQAEKEIRGED